MNQIEWIVNQSGEIGVLYKNKTFFLYKWHNSFIDGCESFRLIDQTLDFKDQFLISSLKNQEYFDSLFYEKELIKTTENKHWIVNQDGELGIYIDGVISFLSKNQNPNSQWRLILKREFGESCYPPSIQNNKNIKNYIGYNQEDSLLWKTQ